jgi:hypothetical protein
MKIYLEMVLKNLKWQHKKNGITVYDPSTQIATTLCQASGIL